MSHTRVLTVAADNVTRVKGSTKQGAGKNHQMYAGTQSSYDYQSYLKFTMNWTGMGRIVSAVLTTFTDNKTGRLAAGTAPRVTLRVLNGAFADGNNSDDVFDSSDYTAPTPYSAPHYSPLGNATAGGVNNWDIADFVELWAPAYVAKRSGAAGSNKTNHGLVIDGYSTATANRWSGWSQEHTDPQLRPYLTITYELGLTAPDAPTTLAPTGAVAAIGAFGGDFTSTKTENTLYSDEVEVYSSPVTATGQAISLNGGVKVWSRVHSASATEIVNARFNHIPDALVLATSTTYKWRGRVTDNQNQSSLWTALQSFSVTNTDPDAPTLTPAGDTVASLNGVTFRGGEFSDADSGDTLLAYQVQMSAYASGSPNWDDPALILWDTGKKYVASGATNWETPYGGAAVDAGAYYWRARVWDNHDGVSAWTYAAITLSANFDVAPGSQTSVQVDPLAPWRIVIREMAYLHVGGTLTGVAATDLLTTGTAHGFEAAQKVRFSSLSGGAGLTVGPTYYVIASGLTPTSFKVSTTEGGSAVNVTSTLTAGAVTAVTTRGPGAKVAVLYNAKSVGASVMYNSPGELHFTLPVDDPNINAIPVKECHYAVEFYGGDGWRETFAGIVWDFDATETGIIFYCIDYLALYDFLPDERYDPSYIDKPTTSAGSKYVNTTIGGIIKGSLTVAKNYVDSPVGFISIGSVAGYVSEVSPGDLNQKVTIWSTFAPALNFISGLIDSARQGTGRMTRLQVVKATNGTYSVRIVYDPGVARDDLRMKYGELVQGYRVVAFGTAWAARTLAVGRAREGMKVYYKGASAPGISTRRFGRITKTTYFDNISDENDMIRRTAQDALVSGKLGSQMALGIRSGIIQPLDGYDVCDSIPVSIQYGGVDTTRFGSGYWTVLGVAWEASDQGSTATTMTLRPREDNTAPSGVLLSVPLPSTGDWQIGWTPPPPVATATQWLDQNTGITYRRGGGAVRASGITGSA